MRAATGLGRTLVAVLLLSAAAPARAAPLPPMVPAARIVPLPVPRPPDLIPERPPPAAPAPTPAPVTAAKPRVPTADVQGPPMPPGFKGHPAATAASVPPAPPPVTVEADASCPGQLKAAGIVFEPTVIGPQAEPLCTVAEPVKLLGLDPAAGLPVDFPDRPTLACATALVFADYLKALLLPLARGTFGNAVTAVGTGPGFECRTRDHIPGAKISAHGQGLAVDIAELTLASGRHMAIGAPKDDQERSFDKGARAGACGFFHTALGPGADSFHETHWHFDLQPRGKAGDAKICQ